MELDRASHNKQKAANGAFDLSHLSTFAPIGLATFNEPLHLYSIKLICKRMP